MKVSVKVFPRAKRPRIETSDTGLRVYIAEPAVDGKANKKLIEVLADHFKVKKCNLTIVKGQKQREKTVAISESI